MPGSDDLRSTGSCASAARLVIGLRIDAGEMLRPAGRRHRMRDRAGKPREQVLLARGGIAGFERVEMVGGHVGSATFLYRPIAPMRSSNEPPRPAMLIETYDTPPDTIRL